MDETGVAMAKPKWRGPGGQYVAVIGDIKRSRELHQRDAVQSRLQQACIGLNRRTDLEGLLSPFTVTLGDEFQALFGNFRGVWRAIFAIEAMMGDGVEIRFGIGIGGMDTAINREAAIGMDGPAFHRARRAIDQLKQGDHNYRLVGMGQAESLANSALDLLSLERNSWRANRVRILHGMLEDESVAQIAAALEISPSAVYKNIQQGGLESICAILAEIATLADSHREAQP